jgi:hypothetical protein
VIPDARTFSAYLGADTISVGVVDRVAHGEEKKGLPKERHAAQEPKRCTPEPPDSRWALHQLLYA